MQAIYKKVMQKAARAATTAIYPPLRARAIVSPVTEYDVSSLSGLEREFRPPFVAVPSPDRSEWPEIPEVDVSFVVPCYNVERYVRECVESILAQRTSHTFEIVAVDDGSTDSTGTVLDELAAEDSRVRVIHQANCGFSGARNTGLEKVRGGVIVFVDSDDNISEASVELLMAPLADSTIGFVSGGVVSIDESGALRNGGKSTLAGGTPWGHAFHRELWRRIELPEGYWFEDTVLKYCIYGMWKEAAIEGVVYNYRNNPTSISHTSKRSKKSLDTVWIVQQMILWRRALGGAFDQFMFDQTLKQFGMLAYDRLTALDDAEMRSAFALMCDILASVPEFEEMQTTMQGRWPDVLLALRTRNFKLWSLACYFL